MWVSVCVCGYVAKEMILSSESLDSIRLSGRSSFVFLFWWEDNSKSCAHVNLLEGLRLEVRVKKDKGCWSVEFKI